MLVAVVARVLHQVPHFVILFDPSLNEILAADHDASLFVVDDCELSYLVLEADARDLSEVAEDYQRVGNLLTDLVAVSDLFVLSREFDVHLIGAHELAKGFC